MTLHIRPDAGCTRRGFTLIELLTAIAIVGILAAITFPVLMRARAKGWQTTCISNHKQIVTALLMQVSEAKGILPDGASVWSNLPLDNRVFHCPAQGVKNGYAYNDNLSGSSLSDYPSHNKVVLVADGKTENNLATHDTELAYRHNDAVIVGCADGHAELLKKNAMIELYPLGTHVGTEKEIEHKFGIIIRPARSNEPYPKWITGNPPHRLYAEEYNDEHEYIKLDEYMDFFDRNTPYFNLFPSMIVNGRVHEIVVSSTVGFRIAPGKPELVNGVWYIASGICIDVDFYQFSFSKAIRTDEWTALNDPPDTPYGREYADNDEIPNDILKGFLHASNRSAPDSEITYFWHVLLAKPNWVEYKAQHDPVIGAKFALFKQRMAEALEVPWSYFDEDFWHYNATTPQVNNEYDGEQRTSYEML